MGFFLLIFSLASLLRAQPAAQEIVRRSIETNNADFQALPKYSHHETDVTTKAGAARGSKTYKVMMLEGSPYNQLIAINNEPLPPPERAREEKKRSKEAARRSRESSPERSKRIARYQQERQHEHLLMNEMARAFDFKLVGQTQLDGRRVYVLDATPRPGYRPPNQKARVLTGMKGKLWVDTQQYHWAKVEAQVIHPVNFGLFIAKVSPGTSFELDQTPIGPNVWLPHHFVEKVNARILGIKPYRTQDEETYTDYHLESGQ